MASTDQAVNSLRKANVEFGVWRESFRRAHDKWAGAPKQLKAPLLLTGPGLVRAENWLLEFPEQLSESEKMFIIRSLSQRPEKSEQRNTPLARARQRQLLTNMASSWVVWACVFAITWFMAADSARRMLQTALESTLQDRPPARVPFSAGRRTAGNGQPEPAAVVARTAPDAASPAGAETARGAGAASLAAHPEEDPTTFDTTTLSETTIGKTGIGTSAAAAAVAAESAKDELQPLHRLLSLAVDRIDSGDTRVGLLLAIEAYEQAQALRKPAGVGGGVEGGAGTENTAGSQAALDTLSAQVGSLLSRGLRTSSALKAPLAAEKGRAASALCEHGAGIVSALATGELQGGLSGRGPATMRVSQRRLLAKPAAFTPDCSAVFLAAEDHVAELWSIASGKRIAALPGHEATVLAAAASADGRLALTASQDATARLWNLTTGRQIALLDQHDGQVTSAAFSPDGRLALTASADRTARLWDTASGRPLKVFAGHKGIVTDATFSRDGKRILSTAWDGVGRVWSIESGEELFRLKPGAGTVRAASYSADGGRIVTVSHDGHVHVWDADTGKALAGPDDRSGPVRSIATSKDGRWLLTVSWTGQLSLASLETGRTAATLATADAGIDAAGFDRSGRFVLATTRDGKLLSWPADVAPRSLAQLARPVAGACLSGAERSGLGLDEARPQWCQSAVRDEAGPSPAPAARTEPSRAL